MNAPPPFYVFLAHSSLSNLPSAGLSTTLAHPIIQYHYADDSPLSLLPTHPDEHVILLNYEHDRSKSTVQSISPALSVTGLKIEDAPGAAVADETGSRNDAMFIIESSDNDHLLSASHGERKSAHAVLSQYKYRNQILRKALQYPGDQPDASTTRTAPQETKSASQSS